MLAWDLATMVRVWLRYAVVPAALLFLAVEPARAVELHLRPSDIVATRAAAPRTTGRLQRRARDERAWVIALPLWGPGATGTMTVGNITLDSDNDATGVIGRLGEAAGGLEFAFMGAVKKNFGRWAVSAGVFGASYGGAYRFTSGGRGVDAKVLAFFLTPRVSYRVKSHKLPYRSCGRCWRLDHRVYAGARIYDVDINIRDRMSRGSRLWADPIIGYSARLDLQNGWAAAIGGDIGGFGIGSDFAWSFVGGIEYRFTRHFALLGAWNMLDVDYRSGRSGTPDFFAVDLHLSGPQIVLNFYI